MALKVGDKAPEFKLKDSFEKEVSLKDFKGKKIILYFYPKDNTQYQSQFCFYAKL